MRLNQKYRSSLLRQDAARRKPSFHWVAGVSEFDTTTLVQEPAVSFAASGAKTVIQCGRSR